MSSKEDAIKKHKDDLEKAKKERRDVRQQAQSNSIKETALVKKYIEKLVGKVPWIEHVYPCIVLKIEEPHVALVNAGFFSGPVSALFGERQPIINRRYELRWPSRGEAPWIKVTHNDRWLYAQRGSNELWRWNWPPPEFDPKHGLREWDGELVTEEVPERVGLIGATTPPNKSTQIVFHKHTEPTNPIPGNPVFKTNGSILYFIEDMGFGDVLNPLRCAPPYVQVMRTANHGFYFGGFSPRAGKIWIPGSTSEDIVGDYLVQQVCCCDVPSYVPPEAGGRCAYIDNGMYIFEPITNPSTEVHLPHCGGALWGGQPSNMNNVMEFIEASAIDSVSKDTTVRWAFYVGAGGCIWPTMGIFGMCRFVEVISTEREYTYTTVGYYAYGTGYNYYNFTCIGTWAYDSKPAALYTWKRKKFIKTVSPYSGTIGIGGQSAMIFATEHIAEEDIPVQFYAPGCVPSGGEIAPIHGVPEFGARRPDTGRLLMWLRAREKLSSNTPFMQYWNKWESGAVKRMLALDGGHLLAVSPDGYDLFALTRKGYAASIDSGDNWYLTDKPTPSGYNWKIIDEVA